MSEKKCIILTGIKHSGKSTQGRILSQKLNCPFIDLDDVIQEMTGKSPREVYKEGGPSAFMIAEENAAAKTLETYKNQTLVIATGGGICDNQPALNILSPIGKFVFLKVAEKTSLERIMKKVSKKSDGTWENLPAYISAKKPETEEDIQKIFHKFYEERTELYSKIADVTVSLASSSKEENAEAIISMI